MVGQMSLGIGVLALGVSGCGGDDDGGDESPVSVADSVPSLATAAATSEPASGPTSSEAASDASAPGRDDGISYDEAVEQSVLVGDYDALIASTVEIEPGEFDIEIANVGLRDDVYDVALDAPADATVSPSVVEVAAGDTSRVHVSVGDNDPADVLLVVVSAGRAGGEVIRIPIGS